MFDPIHCPIDIIEKLLPELYFISKNCKITLLKYSENLTYLVEEQNSVKYILRLNRPLYHKQKELEGELLWIHRIAEDTDIPLAPVIISRNGHFIEQLSFPNNLSCFCSLFAFLEGSSLKDLHDDALYLTMEKIGSITAKLHNHVINWKESVSLNRFSWDWENLFGDAARWGDWSSLQLLTSSQKHLFKETVSVIHKRILTYGKTSQNYGLIHSDLNINNFLVNNEKIQVIDFDDCGYGWFLYDLACCVMMYDGEELTTSVNHWLKGYEQYRPLSSSDKAEIETFILLKKIHRFSWIAEHMESDTVKYIPASYYDSTAKYAQMYLDEIHYLLN